MGTVNKVKEGDFQIYDGGKWQERAFVLYQDSTLGWFQDSRSTSMLGHVNLKTVSQFILGGPMTKHLSNRPSMPSGKSGENFLAVASQPKPDAPIYWIYFPDESTLRSWMDAIGSLIGMSASEQPTPSSSRDQQGSSLAKKRSNPSLSRRSSASRMNQQASGPTQQPYPQQTQSHQAYSQQAYPQQAYPQQAYPQQAYPQQAYAQQAYAQQAYPQRASYPQQAYIAYPTYSQQPTTVVVRDQSRSRMDDGLTTGLLLGSTLGMGWGHGWGWGLGWGGLGYGGLGYGGLGYGGCYGGGFDDGWLDF